MKTSSQVKHKENPFAYMLLPVGPKIMLPEISGENLHLPVKGECWGGHSQMAKFDLGEVQPGPGAKRCAGQGEREEWRGGTVLSAAFSVCHAALPSQALPQRQLTRLANVLGRAGQETCRERTPEPCFTPAVDLVGLILECFPPSVGRESSAQGEGVGWHAQVTLRYVFFFCAYQHFTHQPLFCMKAENPPTRLWLGN